jgi:hypothetical protein
MCIAGVVFIVHVIWVYILGCAVEVAGLAAASPTRRTGGVQRPRGRWGELGWRGGQHAATAAVGRAGERVHGSAAGVLLGVVSVL